MKNQINLTGLKLASGIASTMALLLVAGCTSDRPQVNPSASIPRDDQAIARQVLESFKTNPEYPYAGVRVAANNGDVQLTGYVQSGWQKYNAAAIAARVPGVKVVVNHVMVANDNALTTASAGHPE